MAQIVPSPITTPSRHFLRSILQRAADVADGVGGGQRKEAPKNDDGQFAPLEKRAQARHLPGVAALEEPVEPHRFGEVVDRG